MKKLISFGIALFITTVLVAQNQQYYATNITFGRYGDCSSGRGICGFGQTKIVAMENIENEKYVIYKDADSSLLLRIYKSHITKTDEVQLFGKVISEFNKDEKMHFKMDADFTASYQIENVINTSSSNFKKIQSGLYQVQSHLNYYLIELKLY